MNARSSICCHSGEGMGQRRYNPITNTPNKNQSQREILILITANLYINLSDNPILYQNPKARFHRASSKEKGRSKTASINFNAPSVLPSLWIFSANILSRKIQKNIPFVSGFYPFQRTFSVISPIRIYGPFSAMPAKEPIGRKHQSLQ